MSEAVVEVLLCGLLRQLPQTTFCSDFSFSNMPKCSNSQIFMIFGLSPFVLIGKMDYAVSD